MRSGRGAESARERTRPLTSLVIAVVMVLGIAAWTITPDAVRSNGGVASAPLAVGDTLWIGLPSLAKQALTVRSADALTDAGAEIRVCLRRTPGPIGIVDTDDLPTYCDATLPLAAGTPLGPAGPRTAPSRYLIVGLTATEVGPQVFCGLDVRYRQGLRIGRQTGGDYLMVINPPNEDFDIDAACR